MTLENIGAIVFLAFGFVMTLLGGLWVLAAMTSYFDFTSTIAYHDTFVVVHYAMGWGSILVTLGILFVLFSKPLGRLLVRGLS